MVTKMKKKHLFCYKKKKRQYQFLVSMVQIDIGILSKEEFLESTVPLKLHVLFCIPQRSSVQGRLIDQSYFSHLIRINILLGLSELINIKVRSRLFSSFNLF